MLLALGEGDAMTSTERELMTEEGDEGESEQEELSLVSFNEKIQKSQEKCPRPLLCFGLILYCWLPKKSPGQTCAEDI